MSRPASQAERIAALEVRVGKMIEEQKEINQSLRDLLELRNKGVGAFWLASSLVGTGVVGAVLALIEWIKG